MITINAAVLSELNKPLVIKKLETRPLESGQVLVKILYSGICRSQLMECNGHRGEDKWLPHLLGHEGSGIVQEVGPDVKKFSQGDEVILSWIKGSGIDAKGALYDADSEVINSGQVTTFSNYSVVSENRLFKKPKYLDFDTAILFGCALPTGAGMVINETSVKKDSLFIVIGLGGIGLSAVAMLLSLNVKKIIAIDISSKKLDLVKSWGVSNVINAKKSNLHTLVHNIFPVGADYCIESAGQVSTIELGFSLLNPHKGKLLFASHPPEGEKIKLFPHDLISGKKIAGSWGGGILPDRDIPILFQKFSKANFPLNSFLTKPYSLFDINQALKDLESGEVLRPLIKMEH
ncbi:zinc-binding dehydrogenase [Candidatus Thioglobus sp.]|nr:zinc-binding dehydrogenase [Candidatus Thioglobus sp.]